MHHRFALLLVCSTLTLANLRAQDERFLAFQLQVEANGSRVDHFAVTVFKGNEQVAQLEQSEHDACELMLEIDADYSVRITKPGSRDKLLSIDTHLPAEVERYKAYPCVVEMEAAQPLKGDPFYHDFPVAVIRWDTASNSFEHVGRYSEEIRALCTERLASR